MLNNVFLRMIKNTQEIVCDIFRLGDLRDIINVAFVKEVKRWGIGIIFEDPAILNSCRFKPYRMKYDVNFE